MNEVKDRLNITIPKRLKRQLKDISLDQNMSMNRVINDALKDYVDRVNYQHSAPDFVLDRVNQVLVSQMNLTQSVQTVIDIVSRLENEV